MKGEKHLVGQTATYKGPDMRLRGLRHVVVFAENREVVAWSDPQMAIGSANSGNTWRGSLSEFLKVFVLSYG